MRIDASEGKIEHLYRSSQKWRGPHTKIIFISYYSYLEDYID